MKIKENLKSGLSYYGANKISDFIGTQDYYITTQSGFLERLPRFKEY